MSAKPRLQTLIFEVTQRCNHACLHCYNVWQGESDYPRGELDTARTLNLLGKALDETDCRHVTLTGGEPLLRPDLPVLLDFLGERGVGITLISNGRLLDENRTADCLARGVGLFELPLLSSEREIHDQLSGAPGAWEAVLAAMAEIRLRRGRFVAVFVVTRLNLDQLAETIKLAFAFGARGLLLNRFNPGGRGRTQIESLLPSVAQMRQGLETANEASAKYNLPISCSIPIQPCQIDLAHYPNLGTGFCAAGSERAYYTLDPLGNLRPCNHTDLILGNLFDASFADLIARERMQIFSQALPPFCAECPRRSECQGGCKASAQVCYGSLSAEEPFLYQNRACAVLLPDRLAI